jgi:hypothetical protein
MRAFANIDYEGVYMLYVPTMGSALFPKALATASATVE